MTAIFLPKVYDRARTEIVINSVLFVITMGAFILFFVENYINNHSVLSRFLPDSGLEHVVYNSIFAVFMFGSFTYQVSRLLFFVNLRKRVRFAQQNLAALQARPRDTLPNVEIIVPSYREEVHVIWQTLMSAVLTDYPHRRITLLLDNPPNPTDRNERDVLLASRAQVDVINDMLAPIAAHLSAAATRFFKETQLGAIDLTAAAKTAADLHRDAANWLEDVACRVEAGAFHCPDDHTRRFFVERILRVPAVFHRERADTLCSVPQELAALAEEFRYLEARFKTEVRLFERKQYVNLSLARTKAANLNAYVSLMGRRLVVVRGPNGAELHDQLEDTPLVPTESFEVPDARYIVILDADSFLAREYITHMVSAMEAPENRRAAVIQTPYTAIPGTPHVLERTAGATTDIYFYVTEGMSFAHAGFWVGASAMIRKESLIDIAKFETERGFTVPIYIQDTTVIEDTAATIDLARKGWSVENYPARLSYSSTPSDFGALVVQRRRWANGGLIILPNLLKYIVERRPTPRHILECVLRFHYLIMPASISISMLLMLVYPFDFKRVSDLIYITLPPYLYLVCRDLKHTGYRRTDILRAYALFLVLLPVVLTGVKNSVIQLLFGVKAQFGRTPKVGYRTAIPLTCTAAIIVLFAWSVTIFRADVERGDGLHAFFALSNVLALGYGLVAMVGIKAIVQDYTLALVQFGLGIRRVVFPRWGEPKVEPVVLSTGLPLQIIPASQIPSLQATTPAVVRGAPVRRSSDGSPSDVRAEPTGLPEVEGVPLQPRDSQPVQAQNERNL
jgi:cellulose synthase (UDP-forming)